MKTINYLCLLIVALAILVPGCTTTRTTTTTTTSSDREQVVGEFPHGARKIPVTEVHP